MWLVIDGWLEYLEQVDFGQNSRQI